MKVIERYASAVHATSLKSDPATYMSDTDVLGAMGLAAKHEPLGAALTRLLSGGGSSDAIDVLSDMVFKRARYERVKLGAVGARYERVKLGAVGARDVAIAVIAWHRHSTCQHCGGRGYVLIPGAPVNGETCPHCSGLGRVGLESNFAPALRELARWASSQIDYSIAAAGDAAMRRIAPRLDL